MNARVFEWDESFRRGQDGIDRLTRYLEGQGRHVIDLSDIAPLQHREIDLIVDHDIYVEVKTDSHRPVNLFVELSAGERPGNVFQSRADIWCYLFPTHRVGYWIRLPQLQHYVALQLHRYPLKTITSRRGSSRWTVQGIAVPIADLRPLVIRDEDVFTL